MVGAALLLVAIHVDSVVIQVGRDEKQIAAQTELAMEQIDHTCSPGPCGSIQQLNKTLAKIGDLTVTGQKAIHDADQVALTESRMLPEWNARFSATLDSTDALIATAVHSVADLTQDAHVTLQTANDTLKPLPELLEAGTQTVRDADAVVSDPNIPRLIKGSADTMVGAALVADNAAKVTTHFERKIDDPKLTFWQKVYIAAKIPGSLAPPLF
jgi:hypothetical protein